MRISFTPLPSTLSCPAINALSILSVNTERDCQEFMDYWNLVRAAQCELKGNVIVFGENRAMLYIGTLDGFAMQKFDEVETVSEIRIYLDAFELYLRRLRKDRRYGEILEMERQRMRVCI